MTAYERIGRTIVAIHRLQQAAGDGREVVLKVDPTQPPSSPDAIADGLDRLYAAYSSTGRHDSVKIDMRDER